MARPRKDPLPPELCLPNEHSKCQTPTTLHVDLHYAQLHVWERWDWNRFSRLCAFLQLTPAELASMACIPHRAIDSLKSRNRLFNGQAPDRAGALVLTLIEAHVAGHVTNDVIASPFPSLDTHSIDPKPEG